MRLYRSAMMLLWAAIATWPVASAQAALTEWTEGWENGNGYSNGTWDYGAFNPGLWTITDTGASGAAPEGTYYMLMPGGSDGNGKELSRSIGSADAPYSVSLYTQTIGSGNKYNYDSVLIKDANGAKQVELRFWKDGTTDALKVRSGAGDIDFHFAISDVWHQTKIYVTPDAVNGLTFKLLMDGTAVAWNIDGYGLTTPSATLILHHASNGGSTVNYIDDIVVSGDVPEPASLALLVVGAVSVVWRRRCAESRGC